ncbi:MAG TPA: Ig-like domain-containing protein [Thermoanaerobaculia bacterium]|nr:Ig-like domain-containing protein [Thermoanaerobaculia bacterium]
MKRALCLLAVLVPSALFAATKTWTGAVNENWSNGGNWSGGVAPVAGDDLAFGSAPFTSSLKNDLAAGTVFHSITCSAFCGMSGNAFGLTNGMTTSGPSSTATFLLPISLKASQTWSGQFGLGAFAPVDLDTNTLTLNTASSGMMGVVSGSGGVVVNGAMNFWAANTFTGLTVVNAAGDVGCACALPGPVTVSGRFTFGAPLSVAVPHTGPLTATGGVISVTDNACASGNLAFNAASTFEVKTFSTSHAPLAVTGAVSLGNAHLTFTPAGYTPPVGTVFTLIDNDGSDPVIGTFAGLPDGARIGGTMQISYHGGSGNDVTLTIVPPQVATATTMAVHPNPTVFGATTTLTARVTSAGGTPTGSVTFYDGTTALATAPLSGGSAEAEVGPLARGSHSISAAYVPDNAGFLASASASFALLVDVPPAATAIALEVTPERSAHGQAVTLTASVTSDSGAPFGNVVFTDGDAILESKLLTGTTMSITTTALSIGEHALRATFVPMGPFLPSTTDAVAHVVVENRRRAARH